MTQKARASVDMSGDLANAFLQEFGARVAKGGTPSKAELGRVLIAEALQYRGYIVAMPGTEWGGYRDQPEKKQDED